MPASLGWRTIRQIVEADVMKKRLRKKKHAGEFQELGFRVVYRPASGLSPEAREELLWAFLTAAIEANGLLAGGGGGEPADFFVASATRCGSATEEQRAAVRQWLAGETRIAWFDVGPLLDAWYGHEA